MQKISPTLIRMYLRCPRQAEFRYVLGLKLPPSGAALKGTAAHRGAEEYVNVKLHTGEDLPVEAVRDIVADAFDQGRPEAVFAEDEDPGRLKDAAVRSATAWREQVAPGLRPVAAEEWREAVTPGGAVVYGRLDCIEEQPPEQSGNGTGAGNGLASGNGQARLVVRDMKNTARTPDEDVLHRDPQAAAYVYLLGGQADAQFDYLVETSRGVQHVPRRARFSKADLEDFAAQAEAVAKAFQAGVFPPNRDGWWCSPRWCGYWHLCRGRG